MLAFTVGCAGEAPGEPDVAEPASEPAASPSAEPGAQPSAEPAAEPGAEPSAEPGAEPGAEPSAEPAAEPSAEPENEPDPCGPNEQSASCDGADTIDICNQGQVSSFSCDALCQQDGQPGGTCGPGPQGADCVCSDTPPPEFAHGDLCAPETSGACGFPQSGLLCVVENQGDSQGVCRLVCTQNECLFNDEAISALDTECCDVNNGSRVCANDQVYPDACGG